VGLLRMRAGTALPAEKKRRRRGVAAILAMMFLIMFGSLSAAMAIASRGNITTAATHLHVMRAQSAAETGLSVAETRLREAASRFLMSHSDVTGDFGWDLWRGQLSGYSTYSVIPGRTGPQNAGAPSGIAQALAQAHAMDANVVAAIGINSVTIANAPAGTSTSVFRGSQWVYTPGVAIAPQETGTNPPPPLSYQITYAPLANGTDVRVIVTGYDFNYNRGGQPISRTISKDFRVTKRVNHALISPSRVMLGKNVQIIGDLGLRYDDIEFNNGDPLVTRSDFDGLACAILLNELNLIDDIKFVHPKDMQDGKVEITANDITTNLPYVAGAHLVALKQQKVHICCRETKPLGAVADRGPRSS
jgi:hypothetical protein